MLVLASGRNVGAVDVAGTTTGSGEAASSKSFSTFSLTSVTLLCVLIVLVVDLVVVAWFINGGVKSFGMGVPFRTNRPWTGRGAGAFFVDMDGSFSMAYCERMSNNAIGCTVYNNGMIMITIKYNNV